MPRSSSSPEAAMAATAAMSASDGERTNPPSGRMTVRGERDEEEKQKEEGVAAGEEDEEKAVVEEVEVDERVPKEVRVTEGKTYC
mmetsp:Transcript_32005/g.80282  ORF Transcript_32005/g.80282 Transcript_32005/m.80282 type:complete len:85 (-) Transcript_32005:621-875(-)